MHIQVNGTGCPFAAGCMYSGVSASPRRASLRPTAVRLVLPASCDAVAVDSTRTARRKKGARGR
eukprot:971029-Prymnesium_polylepis.1